MGVSIQWQPVPKKWHDTGGGSHAADVIRRLTGRDGCDFTLDERFLEKLRGLRLGEINEDIWGELIEAIEEHDEIRIQFVY